MGFLDRLFSRPSSQPKKDSKPITDDDLPPEQRWILGPPPDYAWWLNDTLIAISDSHQPLLKALGGRDYLDASVGRGAMSETAKARVLSVLDDCCSALALDERKVPSRHELWPGYDHHVFAQTLAEMKGVCDLLASYIRDGDVANAWKLQRRIFDDHHWQLHDLQALLGRFIVNRQDPSRRAEALKQDVFLSQVELADLYEKQGYTDYWAERGYKPRWITPKIAQQQAVTEPLDPARLAAQMKALFVVLSRGFGAFYDALDPSDREVLVRFLPALAGHGSLGPEEERALKRAANEFGWVEFAIESSTPEPLWPGFSRQTYRRLAQDIGGLASKITASFVIGDLKGVSDGLKNLVLAPGYRDRLWDFQCLLTRYDLVTKPQSEQVAELEDEWTPRMVQHADYLESLGGATPAKGSRPALDWHLKMSDALTREGLDLLRRGQYEDAAELLELALTCDPENGVAALYMAKSLTGAGHSDTAIQFYERAERVANTLPSYWADRGLCLRGLGRYKEALVCIERAVELDPKDGHMWTNKALVLEDLGGYGDAIIDCHRALARDPTDAMALMCKGNCLDLLGLPQDAVQSYNLALQLDPQSAALWHNKAIALWRQCLYAQAIECCERAIALAPDFDKAKSLRDRCLEAVRNGTSPGSA